MEKVHRDRILIWQGVISILFGLAIVIWPAYTILAIIFLVGVYILVMGLIELISGLAHIKYGRSSFLEILSGVVGIVLGILILKYPEISFGVYITLLGLLFILRGGIQFLSPFFQKTRPRFWLMVVGILSVILGIILLANPVISGVVIYWAIGLYTLIAGVIMVVAGLAHRHDTEELKNY